MKPIRHSTSTHMQGELPITKTQAEGQPAIVTFWKPTPEDLMALNTGGIVSLLVIGETMPTVAVAAIKA